VPNDSEEVPTVGVADVDGVMSLVRALDCCAVQEARRGRQSTMARRAGRIRVRRVRVERLFGFDVMRFTMPFGDFMTSAYRNCVFGS
jgi:hypothetical protein